jgi:hypothetical protein
MNGAIGRFAAIALSLGACSDGQRGVSVSSEDYAVQYDYSEFRAATDGKDFPVLLAGDPFPDLALEEANRRLLAAMQANRPPARLIFTLGRRSTYRLVLVFDPANDMNAAKACRDDMRVGPHVAGKLVLFAVYCRGGLPMSQAIGRTTAAGPEDPAVGRLFRDVFLTVFTDADINRSDHGYPGGLQ